ncbi:MAG TPA: hypothetical protein VGK67_32065 [Myxococcales bacterium]|jgi:hypothetical protein
MPRSHAKLALLAALVALASCDLRPPYVFLRLELAPPPDAPSATIAKVAVGFGPSSLTEVPTGGKNFPLTATVASTSAGERELFVEARDASGNAVARGRVFAEFPEVEQGNATVVLRRACDADSGCDRSKFCDGPATCSNAGLFGLCLRTTACGEPAFPCVSLECREEGAQCIQQPHHDLCPPVADEQGILRPRMCDAAAGCVAAPP